MHWKFLVKYSSRIHINQVIQDRTGRVSPYLSIRMEWMNEYPNLHGVSDADRVLHVQP